MIPTRDMAEQLLIWAQQQNPGPWADHSRVAARAAEAIAHHCGLDAQRAYVSGLLHDIGRYEGIRAMHHVVAGYVLLRDKGYAPVHEICLSHSFPCQCFEEYFGENDCSAEETRLIKAYLMDATFNEYDQLIQLCDALATAEGVTLIDVRILDVIRRHGFSSRTPEKIEAVFALKKHFDERCGMNLYDLFYDEIREVSFR